MARPGKPLKIAALGVDQVTGQAEMSQFKAQDWGEHIVGPTALVKTFAQWREFVGKSLSDSDVLIVMSTDMLMADAEEKVVPEKEVIQWTEKHATPLPIGIRASYVRYGGGLSVSSPPRVYGLLGMHMTLQWLSAGVDSAPPAAMEIPDFNVSMRTPELEKRKVTLPQVYRELARASGGLFP